MGNRRSGQGGYEGGISAVHKHSLLANRCIFLCIYHTRVDTSEFQCRERHMVEAPDSSAKGQMDMNTYEIRHKNLTKTLTRKTASP